MLAVLFGNFILKHCFFKINIHLLFIVWYSFKTYFRGQKLRVTIGNPLICLWFFIQRDISTPLGSYNPNWVVSWKDGDEEKLYFVVESKGSSEMDLRPKEQSKIACGKKHFKKLGSEMVVATMISDFN